MLRTQGPEAQPQVLRGFFVPAEASLRFLGRTGLFTDLLTRVLHVHIRGSKYCNYMYVHVLVPAPRGPTSCRVVTGHACAGFRPGCSLSSNPDFQAICLFGASDPGWNPCAGVDGHIGPQVVTPDQPGQQPASGS